MQTKIWSLVLVIIGTLVSAFAPIKLKKAASRKVSLASFFKNTDLLVAIALYAAGIFIYIIALNGGDLSVLYPIASLSYVWAVFLSARFLGEKITKGKLIGVGIIIIGVFFIGLGSR